MTDHDPEFPYVIKDYSGHVFAKFHKREKGLAKWFAENHPHYKEVIDTTPRPKIPEDARFIYWTDNNVEYYARKTVEGIWIDDLSEEYPNVSSLIAKVGDSDVTVLVPKEEA